MKAEIISLATALSLCTACSYNISNSMAHTQGEATDVVDEQQSADTKPDISANANAAVNSPSATQDIVTPPTKPQTTTPTTTKAK